MADSDATGLFVNLEVKADTLAECAIANPCVDALEKFGLANRAVVSSFHPGALLHIDRRSIDRAALVESGSSWRTSLAAGLMSRPVSINPESVLVTPARVKLWHTLGYRVATWTVDDPEEASRVLDAGVDVVISNRPDVMLPVAERYRRTMG